MKRFRSFLAVLLTFCIAISFISISNTYAVTEMSQEERDRIESIFGCVMERENTSSLFSVRSSRTIADGVYYIKNNYSGKYLQIRDDSTEDDSVPEQWSKKTANPTDTEPNRLSQLWRVTYVGGYYILRPLHMLNLALAGQPSSHYITSVLYSTNNVISYCEWEITAANGGYSIGSCLLDKALCLKENSTNNGVELSFTTDFTNTSAIWTFEEATNVPSGVMVYAPQATVTKGKDFTITASAYSPSLQFGTVTWQSSNTAVATATEPTSGITESRLVKRVITGVAQGSANIIITSSSAANITKSFTVGVGEVDNGRYYFANNKTHRVLDIENASHVSGATIHQWDFYGKDSQEWILELQTDGYYTIKSYESNLYLSVENNSDGENAAVTQESGGSATGQRWKISKLADNVYKISAKCGENNDRCLAVANYLFDSNGINIVHKKYANASNYQDEWTLLKIEVAAPIAIEAQKKSNWCWAATARMFAKNYYHEVSLTQNDAVSHIKGSEVDEGGTIVEAQNAMQYYISNISGASYNLQYNSTDVYSEEIIRRFLDDGHVIYIVRSLYPDINNPNYISSSHATLIYGYLRDDTGFRYMIRDPAPVNEGSSYYMSYNRLFNGRNNMDWENYDKYIWTQAIVRQTDYSNQTIRYYFG